MTGARGPRISLCIVARNEASFVGACIESARPVVDEVVLVDTGSTDGTPGIAARAGARVIRAVWPGDLGRAHDLPLVHARGDWILSLDADEVLDPGLAPALRRIAECGGCDGYRLPIRNYAYYPMVKWRRADPRDPLARGALGYIPTFPVRLFRRRPSHRYRGFLHQSVAPSILAAGGRIGSADVLIHHYGHLRVDRAKGSFYVALARRQAMAEPDDAQAWIELGSTLLVHGLYPAALATFRTARGLARSASASFGMGDALLEMKQPAAALPHLIEAVRRNPRDEPKEFDRADGWEAIARAHEMLGRPGAAAGAYRQALAVRPHSPVALNDLAALLIERGALRRAEPLLRRLLTEWPGLDMPWATLGTLRLRQGDLVAARHALETALDIQPRSVPARMNLRACRAVAAGQPPSARAPVCDVPRAADLVLRPLGAGGVVSFISHLGGGAGRVLVDTVHALQGRPQLVLCFHTDAHTRQGLRAELARARVRVITVSSGRALRAVLERVRPDVVIDHWWANLAIRGRVGAERWVAVGHSASPMPLGYDAYVVVSDFNARGQRHLPAARVHKIPNGVDLGRFERPWRPPRRPVTIAMLTRFDPGKFPRRLLDYLPRLETLGARLVIAGRGGRRYEIEPEIRDRGLGRAVRFVGPISTARVPEFLTGADIGFHLTETAEEQCSLSILEMLAAGLPVVAEPKGCLPEMVSHGVNGVLSLEATQVAAALERLIRSAGLRRRMGAASRRRAREWGMPRFSTAWRGLIRAVAATAPVRVVPPAARVAPFHPTLAFVVCCTPRAGGGLLCEALGNTGVAGHPDDFFEPDRGRSLGEFRGPTELARYLASVLEIGTTPNGVFAARLTLAGLQTLQHSSGGRLLDEFLPSLRWVWVSRRDRLRQAISWVRALQTGTWAHLVGDQPLPAIRLRFDRHAIAQRLEEIEAQDLAWRTWFAERGVVPIPVVYERVASDYEGTARRVAGRLGVELPRALFFGERRMLPMADATSEAWARRFLEGARSGTRPSPELSRRRTIRSSSSTERRTSY